MRKNLEKIFASASIVVAIILIMVLLVTAFGGISSDEFESDLVQGLLITLAILYLVLAIFALVMMFINSDIIKEVVIRNSTGGSVRVSSKVINKNVKECCKEIEGLKCKKVVLVQDDYGVRLKVNVKIVDKDVIETEIGLRTKLEDRFMNVFGFRFESIEIKVMVLVPKYDPDKEAIENLVAERVAEVRAEQEEQTASENAEQTEEQAEAEEISEAVEQTEEEAVEESVEEDAETEEPSEETEEAAEDEASEEISEETSDEE